MVGQSFPPLPGAPFFRAIDPTYDKMQVVSTENNQIDLESLSEADPQVVSSGQQTGVMTIPNKRENTRSSCFRSIYRQSG
ncbi:MAG: hypothetical protein V1862_02475 [Methanobacteriota archaeon]